MIKRVDWVNELDAVTPNPRTETSSADCMLVFNSSPDKLTLEIPQPFEQFPAQERNLEFVVPCHSRLGGVIIYYPISVNIVDGI